MTLQTGGEVRFKPRTIEGAPDASSKVMPESLLLDGQQRITSLYQTTMRQAVVDCGFRKVLDSNYGQSRPRISVSPGQGFH